ncbi:hypothetical protein OSTOST_14027, partial [Ostertagia ostertagi]
MELAEKVYNQTKKKYEAGTGSQTEINSAQTDMKAAQTNYINALYDAVIARIDFLKATVGITLAFLSACGSDSKEKNKGVADLKAKLEKLKKEKNGLDAQIRQVEEQIIKADPAAAEQVLKLVSADTLRIQDFAHYIELQGKIDADGVAYVAPGGMGGLVKAVYVNLGSRVSKGQVILKLDDVMARQSLISAQQQVSGAKAQLAQAASVYQRQQNLWKENIGTEIQVINAKTAVETLQSQVRAAEAQFATVADMQNIVVRSSTQGASVYLRDIAELKDTIKDKESYARLDGKNVVTLNIVKRAGENLINTSDKIKAVVAEMQKNEELPKDLRVEFTGDQSKQTKTSFNELINTIIIGFILVLLILMFFMGVTNAFFVALSVPLSVFVAFMFLPIADAIIGSSVTLNFIVLFALLFGLGIIVDDAIVVIENTHRIYNN